MIKLFTVLILSSICFIENVISQVQEIKFFKNTNEFLGARALTNGRMLFSAQDDNVKAQLFYEQVAYRHSGALFYGKRVIHIADFGV